MYRMLCYNSRLKWMRRIRDMHSLLLTGIGLRLASVALPIALIWGVLYWAMG